jgi:hypothetical protein
VPRSEVKQTAEVRVTNEDDRGYTFTVRDGELVSVRWSGFIPPRVSVTDVLRALQEVAP